MNNNTPEITMLPCGMPTEAFVVIDTCDVGHKFAKLSDHPKRDGVPRCPHCMSIGLDSARATLEEVEDVFKDQQTDLVCGTGGCR